MGWILTIAGILILGFVLNVILKQSYNIIFFTWQKPFLWLLFMFIAGIAFWGIGILFSWNLNIIVWSSIMALYLNFPPGHKDKEDKASAIKMVDKMYVEMGIKKGRLLYRLGLISFALSCVTSWLLFYGEVCTETECQTIFNSLF